MCSWGIALGVSAIASMTSSVKAAGCGLVNRTRSRPSIAPVARSSLPNARRSPNSTPYELTFWPSRVTSMTPSATSISISARMSPGRRSFSLPRSDGTMQKVQVLLQPTEIDTQPLWVESRRAGSVEGKTSSDSRISICALSLWRARSSRVGREPMLWVPNTTSTYGALSRMTDLSFWARQPPTAICIPSCSRLMLARCPRVP